MAITNCNHRPTEVRIDVEAAEASSNGQARPRPWRRRFKGTFVLLACCFTVLLVHDPRLDMVERVLERDATSTPAEPLSRRLLYPADEAGYEALDYAMQRFLLQAPAPPSLPYSLLRSSTHQLLHSSAPPLTSPPPSAPADSLLQDGSVSVEKEHSETLGRGLRCGFHGLLHLEVPMRDEMPRGDEMGGDGSSSAEQPAL